MGDQKGTWGEIEVCNQSPASRHSVGRGPGSLLSTQPSVGVSSPTRDSLLSAFEQQDMQQYNTTTTVGCHCIVA